MEHEIEIKLVADDAFDESAMIDRLAAVGQVSSPELLLQEDRYLDTDDDELRAAGLSARVRARGEHRSIAVKPVPVDPALVMDRAELVADVDPGGAPGDVLARLLATQLGLVLRGEPHEKVVVSTRRSRRQLVREDLVAELCVDRVRVGTPGRPDVDGFTEVELELEQGDAADLETVVEPLRGPGLSPSGCSKLERARGLLGLPGYRYGAAAPEFERDAPAGEVARAIGRRLLEAIVAHEPGARVGLDPEHVHKMRVATRRLRTALRVFHAAFDRDERKRVAKDAKWLGRVLGEVRDLDVHLLALGTWRDAHGREPALGWRMLEEALQRRRARARERLLVALDDRRHAELIGRARDLFEPADASISGSTGARGGDEPIGRRAGHMLAERVEAFEHAVERFRSTHDPGDAHKIRIAGKRLRYTAEFVKPLLDDDARHQIKGLARFQDDLGEMQDVVSAGKLAETLAIEAVDVGPEGDAYREVLGRLTRAAAAVGDEARPRVDGALEQLDARHVCRALGRVAAHLEED